MVYKRHKPEEIDQMIIESLGNRARTMREVLDEFLLKRNITGVVIRHGIWRLINDNRIEVVDATKIRVVNTASSRPE